MKYFCLLIIILVSIKGAIGQISGTSPYSVYGLGIPTENYSSINRGMGGAGIALTSASYLSYLNPASYTAITSPSTAIFDLGFFTERNTYTTSDESHTSINGSLSNINYWFRPSRKWASMLGLTPYTTVSYNILSSKTLALNERASYLYKGDGNVVKVYWGNAFQVNKNLSFGLNIAYLFGSIEKSESVYSPYNLGVLTLTNNISTRKFTADVGVLYKFDIGGKRTVSWGLVYDPGVTLDSKSTTTLMLGGADTLQVLDDQRGSYSLPKSAGTGISLSTKRSLLAIDAKFKAWSRAGSSTEGGDHEDTWRLSTGYTYLGHPEPENYWQLVQFRTGIYYQNYHSIIDDTSLDNYGFTAGIAIPFSDGRSSLALTYSYDRFGTDLNGLIKQTTNRLSVDLTIRDLWGLRRRFD